MKKVSYLLSVLVIAFLFTVTVNKVEAKSDITIIDASTKKIVNPQDLKGNNILHYKSWNTNYLYATGYCQVVQKCSGAKNVVLAADNSYACRCENGSFGCGGKSCTYASGAWQRIASVTCTGCPVANSVPVNILTVHDLANKLVKIDDGTNRYYYVTNDLKRIMLPDVAVIGSQYKPYINAILDSNGISTNSALTAPVNLVTSMPIVDVLKIKSSSLYILKKQSLEQYYIVDHGNYIREVDPKVYSNYSVVTIPDTFLGGYSLMKLLSTPVLQSVTNSMADNNLFSGSSRIIGKYVLSFKSADSNSSAILQNIRVTILKNNVNLSNIKLYINGTNQKVNTSSVDTVGSNLVASWNSTALTKLADSGQVSGVITLAITADISVSGDNSYVQTEFADLNGLNGDDIQYSGVTNVNLSTYSVSGGTLSR